MTRNTRTGSNQLAVVSGQARTGGEVKTGGRVLFEIFLSESNLGRCPSRSRRSTPRTLIEPASEQMGDNKQHNKGRVYHEERHLTNRSSIKVTIHTS